MVEKSCLHRGRHGLMDRVLSRRPGGPGSNPAYSSLLYFSDFEEQLEINREKSIFNRKVRKRDRNVGCVSGKR